MSISLTTSGIKRLDKSGMLGLLLDFPLQIRAALDIAEKSRISFEDKKFNKIVFAGLGGSAIGADLVRAYLYHDCVLPLSVCREYELPGYIDESTLIFISSYSGNTEETLSAYKAARVKNASIIAVSSGGMLRDCAAKDGVPFIEIPQGFPPRCALGYLSIIPLVILSRLGFTKNATPSIQLVINQLEDLKKNCLSPGIGLKDNIAKLIASRLKGKLAVIYAAGVHFDVCAIRLRGQLNENAKTLAWSHVFPEMNHNEIVGWQNPAKLFKSLVVLMLRDKGMHPRVAKRMDITREMIKKEGATVIELWSRGEDLLSRIFSLVYIGDFISLYLAVLYGIDPTPVEKVTYLKNELAKIR